MLKNKIIDIYKDCNFSADNVYKEIHTLPNLKQFQQQSTLKSKEIYTNKQIHRYKTCKNGKKYT